MPLLSVNGIDLYYEEAGDGLPLLLISGAGGKTLDWTPLLPALSERFRVVSFDNRGGGRSSAPPGPYTTRQMADDATALLDHLAITRAHVVGLSLGGMIGQELALAAPARVDRLVLLATYARPRLSILAPWQTFLRQAREQALDPTGYALCTMPWYFTPAFMVQQEQVEAALAKMLSAPYPTPGHGLTAQAAAARHHDALERLSAIAAPTLVLVGAEDIVTPPSSAQELAAGIPGARLQVLERGGHLMSVEYPEAVAEALLAFLAG
jgi:3-oxoadipate enol-lactonase